ncbi:M15 family metallopeptidase [Oerskovia rustica]|uniref:D-alanyl-D-alanine carboxypeptidase family protein n=1 Tax=Oerskovia rustica TaxID=2762237 RepID=A0ABR8RQC5_9CELL|nr:M15 family metallopeptidase [Oerskovia rustica]MBD7949990.1 D-alanyl-D-alanine carboxypeptidase family protein [Oerskovia rustica]
MGKHSQRRFAATLPGRSLRRRSPFAVAAALAAVAVTTTAGAASLVTTPTTAQVSAASTTGTAASTVTSVAGASASTPEEQAALEAASTELVRAEYLASEGTSSLAPEQLAQITATRDQLRQLLSAATTTENADEAGTGAASVPADAATDTSLDADGLDSGPTLEASGSDAALDGRDTFRASRAGTEGRESLTADAGTTTPEAAPAEPAAADADPATVEADPSGQAQIAPTIDEIGAATEALRTLLDSTSVTVSVEPGPPSAEEIAAQQAAEREAIAAQQAAERAAMASQLAAWANSTAGYSNGNIPTDLLCSPSFAPGHFVRCDGVYYLEQLNTAYRAAFGTDISVTSSYRSYASQVSVKASKGSLAAPPGTSNHGMGQALDLGGGINQFGTAQYNWMRENAPAYGWDNPTWARPGGANPEAWHWEFGTTY